MKWTPLILLAAALAASSADARRSDPRRGPQGPPVPANCPLQIGFSSYGAGIDRTTYQAVQTLLRRDRGVRSVSEHNWGPEGETTLCANTRSRADSTRLFHRISRQVPARPRGPVSLRTREGLRFHAPAQRRGR